jgi:hypothetical protein
LDWAGDPDKDNGHQQKLPGVVPAIWRDTIIAPDPSCNLKVVTRGWMISSSPEPIEAKDFL